MNRADPDTDRQRHPDQDGNSFPDFCDAGGPSSVSIVITDSNGTIISVNPAFSRITGYQPEDVVGKNPRTLQADEALHDEYDRFWDIIRAGSHWRGEFHNPRLDSESHWDSGAIVPILNRPASRLTLLRYTKT